MEEKLYFKFNETLTQDDFTALSKKLPAIKSVWIIYTVLFALCALLAFITVKNDMSQLYAQIFSLTVLVLAMVILAFMFPKILGKRLYKNAVKLNSLSGEVAFCENTIYDTDVNGYRKFAYTQIDKVVETDTHYFLFFGKSTGMILKKDSITYSEGDFAAFMNGKIKK